MRMDAYICTCTYILWHMYITTNAHTYKHGYPLYISTLISNAYTFTHSNTLPKHKYLSTTYTYTFNTDTNTLFTFCIHTYLIRLYTLQFTVLLSSPHTHTYNYSRMYLYICMQIYLTHHKTYRTLSHTLITWKYKSVKYIYIYHPDMQQSAHMYFISPIL